MTTDGWTVQLGDLVLTGTDAYGVVWTCGAIDGWAGSPASTLSPVQKTRAPGAWASPRQLTAKTLAPTGQIIAPSADALRDAMDRLNEAVSIDGALLQVTQAGVTRSCLVYRQDEVLSPAITDTVASYSIQVVALDPRKLGTPLSAATGLPSVSGGWSIPWSIPWSIDSTVVSGQCQLTNPGNTTGSVRVRISGPVAGPVITHVTTGEVLAFSSSLSLGPSEWLDIDMDARAVLANGQSSRNAYITSRGWSGFAAGLNLWAYTAFSGSAPTLAQVTATPAWQ